MFLVEWTGKSLGHYSIITRSHDHPVLGTSVLFLPTILTGTRPLCISSERDSLWHHTSSCSGPRQQTWLNLFKCLCAFEMCWQRAFIFCLFDSLKGLRQNPNASGPIHHRFSFLSDHTASPFRFTLEVVWKTNMQRDVASHRFLLQNANTAPPPTPPPPPAFPIPLCLDRVCVLQRRHLKWLAAKMNERCQVTESSS